MLVFFLCSLRFVLEFLRILDICQKDTKPAATCQIVFLFKGQKQLKIDLKQQVFFISSSTFDKWTCAKSTIQCCGSDICEEEEESRRVNVYQLQHRMYSNTSSRGKQPPPRPLPPWPHYLSSSTLRVLSCPRVDSWGNFLLCTTRWRRGHVLPMGPISNESEVQSDFESSTNGSHSSGLVKKRYYPQWCWEVLFVHDTSTYFLVDAVMS